MRSGTGNSSVTRRGVILLAGGATGLLMMRDVLALEVMKDLSELKLASSHGIVKDRRTGLSP